MSSNSLLSPPDDVAAPSLVVVEKDDDEKDSKLWNDIVSAFREDGFPNLSNEQVHIFKCKFAYPVTEPMIQQLAQLLGHNINYVRMVNTAFDDSIDNEMVGYENEMKDTPLLQHDEMNDNGKEASKEYGDKYLDSIHKHAEHKNVGKVGLPADQKNTKDSFDPWKPWTDDSVKGDKSPFTDIKRAPKPETSAGL